MKIFRICATCKKEFLTELKEVNRGKGKYCSLSCAASAGGKAVHEKHDLSGKNNPNYKGGLRKSKYEHKLHFIKNHPEKAKAHNLLRQEIRSGRIVRGPCEICGTTKNIHGHHDDYSKPLEVRWLCQKHHIWIHSL